MWKIVLLTVLGFALAVDAYAAFNYEVLKSECVERKRVEFEKMLKQTKVTVNGRQMRFYGFNESADNVITLSTTRSEVKLPMMHLNFQNLIKYDASYNNIEKIDDIGNETFPYLRLFNLSHNAISSVKSHLFSHLKEVEILDLSHNCFVEFHYDIVFLKHEKLKELYLHDNLLHKVRSMLQGPKVMTLDFLDISHNFLQSFTSFSIEIKHLEISNNVLESLKIFHGDQMTLNAQNNKIAEFSSLASFKFLNLSHNELANFFEIKFKQATAVDLSYNKLKEWTDDENKPDCELLLEISSEEKDKLKHEMIVEDFRIKVEHLNLAFNYISDVSKLAIFKDCTVLNLEGNHLKNIDLEEFRVMFPMLKRVNLKNNPLSPVDESDLKFFNSTQFLQLHFDYSFTTDAPQTSTFLPTLPPIFLPPFHPITKVPAAMSTTKTIDNLRTTEKTPTTSTRSMQTESTAHTESTTGKTERHQSEKLQEPFVEKSSKVWIFALVFLAIMVSSMTYMGYRKHRQEPRYFKTSYNETESFF